MNVKAGRNVIKIKRRVVDLMKIIVGTIIMAIGIDLFLLPNQLSTGGFSGIGTVLYYTLGLSVGTTMLILNIPLFIISYFKVGKKFFINAILGTISFSYFLNVFEKFIPITTDRFLAFLYGSVIVGIGTAIILKARASTRRDRTASKCNKSIQTAIKDRNINSIF